MTAKAVVNPNKMTSVTVFSTSAPTQHWKIELFVHLKLTFAQQLTEGGGCET